VTTSFNGGLEKRLGLGFARSRSWSRGKNQTSRSRLGLVELQEGLSLVSDQKPNVVWVSARSRLHP